MGEDAAQMCRGGGVCVRVRCAKVWYAIAPNKAVSILDYAKRKGREGERVRCVRSPLSAVVYAYCILLCILLYSQTSMTLHTLSVPDSQTTIY